MYTISPIFRAAGTLATTFVFVVVIAFAAVVFGRAAAFDVVVFAFVAAVGLDTALDLAVDLDMDVVLDLAVAFGLEATLDLVAVAVVFGLGVALALLDTPSGFLIPVTLGPTPWDCNKQIWNYTYLI
ncbi:MAG TPA: hypothetical protein VK436_15090 [Methanocella sp.]|nr:hypothetical protein [Methanocella sp.]